MDINAEGQNPVISVRNLRKRFNLEAGFFAKLGRFVNAVNGISFSIGKNKAYGLVGESGCGKTTTARLLVRMYEADEGDVFFYGQKGENENVRKLSGAGLKRYREKVKYVFQDPARSLNPRMTVYEVLTSGARWAAQNADSFSGSKPADAKFLEAELREKAAAILEEVGLSSADLERRSVEFSGGQRQRISIARGLIMKPDLLICDEVVSALDVSVQGQILNLLLSLRESREISFLFIAHDLKVASYFCDLIGVMYKGEIMEEAPAQQLWKDHLHPYTELLFSSASGRDAALPQSAAGIADTALRVEGCSFAERCPYAYERCFAEKPELETREQDHLVRCWRR